MTLVGGWARCWADRGAVVIVVAERTRRQSRLWVTFIMAQSSSHPFWVPARCLGEIAARLGNK